MKVKVVKIALVGILTGSTLVSLSGSVSRTNNSMPVFKEDSKRWIQDDEYKTYRTEQEKKIAENEMQIAELRAKKDKVKKENLAKYDAEINKLEQKNKDLKKRIVKNYKNEGKEKWEAFKKEFNHDMDELKRSLQNLFKDNVKN